MVSLNILSAMITPVVLILATGQLILTTSQRLARSVERARKLSDQFEQLIQKQNRLNEDKEKLLYQLLFKAAHRSRKLQKAMSLLYVALSFFVGTSVTIGIFEALDLSLIWVPVTLGLVGAVILFYATILLISETRLALSAVDEEMLYFIENYGNYITKTSPTRKSEIGKPDAEV